MQVGLTGGEVTRTVYEGIREGKYEDVIALLNQELQVWPKQQIVHSYKTQSTNRAAQSVQRVLAPQSKTAASFDCMLTR